MGTGGAGASGVGTSGMGTSGSSATSRMDDSMNQHDESGVGGKARKLAHDAKEKATDATRSQLTTQKSRAADSLGVIAESLRTSGDRLRERHEDGAGKLFNEAADQLQRFAGAIEGRDVNEMVGEVERFARRQPAVFLGGAFAIGLISARFFKSSGRNAERSGEYPRDRYDTRGSDYMLDREVPTAPVIDPNPTDASARSTTTGRTPELGT